LFLCSAFLEFFSLTLSFYLSGGNDDDRPYDVEWPVKSEGGREGSGFIILKEKSLPFT